jgi:hypothetical protein
MREEEDYEAAAATEAAAEQWWDDLLARSVGSCDILEWGYIQIGVMLRRYAAKHPQGLSRYRTFNGWAKLIREEETASDPELSPEYGRDIQVDAFFRAADNRWSILSRREDYKYSINRVATLDEDITYAQDKQRRRMDEEQRLREQAGHKQGK